MGASVDTVEPSQRAKEESCSPYDVCAVIVSHNSWSWLEPALSSLRAHAGSLALDVVVVDNGEDGSAERAAQQFEGVRGIRCVLCWNEESARLGRQHNDANMLSLGQRMMPVEMALAIYQSQKTGARVEFPLKDRRHPLETL